MPHQPYSLDFNPLELDNLRAYHQWRDSKRHVFEQGQALQAIDIDAANLDSATRQRILNACQLNNFCLYRLAEPALGDKAFVRDTGLQLGLQRLDGNLCSDEDNISSIQVMGSGRHSGYIPYTDKQLTWHTDGYYNEASRTIYAMILHCARPAKSGGENLLLDHEMAYIQLREQNIDYIKAFMQPDVLTIPPNIENGKEIRGAITGPVFSLEQSSGRLHMRYSARTRNIEWKTDSLTQEAVACMRELLDTNNPYVINYRMQAGEGIIANNVLHNRTAFIDAEQAGQTRLLYRARYYDRVRRPEDKDCAA